MTEAPVLEVEDLVGGPGGGAVLRGVSLVAAAGEVVAVAGPSGAGKTTLLRCLAGLLPPWGGSVRIAGEPVASLPAHILARRGVGYLPSRAGVFPGLTVGEHLRLAAQAGGADGVEEVLSLLPELRPLRRRRAGALGRPEQASLAAARALLLGRRLLLVDDARSRHAAPVMETLVEEARRRGAAAVLTELPETLETTGVDRAYLLVAGEIRGQGAGAEVVQEARRAGFLRGQAAGGGNQSVSKE